MKNVTAIMAPNAQTKMEHAYVLKDGAEKLAKREPVLMVTTGLLVRRCASVTKKTPKCVILGQANANAKQDGTPMIAPDFVPY